MTTVYAQQHDTVDLICHRFYGATTGTVEKVYAANHGLAALGPVLPHGTPVTLPNINFTPEPTHDLVQLWD